MHNPIISVVTASLNSRAHIGQTLDSVSSQAGVECEHIVADGGSTDGTQEIIRAKLKLGGRWVSEPDTGIADAMNKGLRLAKGEWLLFLQSDDFLCDSDVLAKASALLGSDLDICAFPVRYGDERASRVLRPRGAGFWLNFKTGLLHQGAFIRRRLFERLGDYDASFRIAMDYEFFLRAYRAGARFACFPEPVVALMRDTGVSGQRDWPSLVKRFDEERRVHTKWATSGLSPLYAAWWALYPRYRRLLSERP